jgi:aquaporin Z
MVKDYQKYAAELLGTAALVFFGCGSAVIAGTYIGFLGIALAFGLTLVALVYAIGHISGCHVNPAVTVAMLVNGKIKPKDAGAYIAMQVVGGILGAAILFAIVSNLGDVEVANLGQNGYDDGSPSDYTMAVCFLAEVVLTMLFLLVIFGSTGKSAPGGFAGIPIGLSLVAIHLVGIPITGTSVNPARSLGPALLVGGDALSQVWLFWAAPIAGAVLGALIWKYVLESKD